MKLKFNSKLITVCTILFLLGISIIYTSCTKNNSGENKIKPISIVGKWTYQVDTVRYYNSGILIQEQPYTYALNSTHLTFNQDGTGFSDFLIYNYTINNKTLITNYPSQPSRGGQFPAKSDTTQIQELSANKLKLYTLLGHTDKSVFTGNEVVEVLTR
ncbi:hypothetical protein [Mucilaginibacter lappiensis]|uniref:Lipocalin-like domain-containing protein n=1 Tax=Mucilaginibacter lappiensis TaxID=354630 RepID=A0A841JHI4_9SPHI|nr:hypothetical protein [Mucilaginibacter lappiensis]MBB6130370.1 hypothetical protein [Mucilaginibacter lappiensis]